MPRRFPLDKVRIIRDIKLALLLPPTEPRMRRMEASGVFARGRFFYVACDNMTAIGKVPRDLKSPGAWRPTGGRGPGYEDVTFSRRTQRFYLLVESERRARGDFTSVVEECDVHLRYRERHALEYAFEHRNKGFEGLACVVRDGHEHLLAICEGNKCLGGRRGRKPGGGRIRVFRKIRSRWRRVGRIKLPKSLPFEDYAALAIRGDRIAVVSQASALLWVGRLRRRAWKVVDDGVTYDLPRNGSGQPKYCNVEGLSWLSATRLVAVSDRMKRGDQPGRCAATDESIHIFELPRPRRPR